MIYKYLDRAFFIDIAICLFLVLGAYIYKYNLLMIVKLPSLVELDGFRQSLVTLGVMMIGFLMTIITVLVTFKEGFEKTINKKEKVDNVFDQKTSIKEKFYSLGIYKKVANVFIYSTFEIGLAILNLLLFQINIFNFSDYFSFVNLIISFLLISFTLLRSFYVFKLFLDNHLS